MNRRKTLVGLGLILALMALTGWVLLKDLPLGSFLRLILWDSLSAIPLTY